MFMKKTSHNTLSNMQTFSSHTQILEEYQEYLTEINNADTNIKVGDYVNKDDVICYVELDKIGLEIRAEKSGFITSLN